MTEQQEARERLVRELWDRWIVMVEGGARRSEMIAAQVAWLLGDGLADVLAAAKDQAWELLGGPEIVGDQNVGLAELARQRNDLKAERDRLRTALDTLIREIHTYGIVFRQGQAVEDAEAALREEDKTDE